MLSFCNHQYHENKHYLTVSLAFPRYADLILLDGEGSPRTFPDQAVTDDWVMAPVPESLPEPDLQPAIPEPPPVGDLISFTEFDMDMLFAAIDNMGLSTPLSTEPSGDLTELLAESNELSGEYNGACSPKVSYRVPLNERRSASEVDLMALELPNTSRDPQARPSPVKPGVLLLSEVEADLLSYCHSQPEMTRKLPSTSAAFTGEAVGKPIVQQRKSSDEDKKTKARKFSAPKVKLAASFSKAPSK